jgi:ribosomal protein L14E/L6E/L27E
MMSIQKAQIVYARKGHDSGRLYCVMDVGEGWVLLANGKQRRVERPKRKNVRHVESAGQFDHPTIEKVKRGQPVGNRELLGLLAVLRDEMEA